MTSANDRQPMTSYLRLIVGCFLGFRDKDASCSALNVLATVLVMGMNTRDEFRNVSVKKAVSVTGWPCTESRPELETVNK